ncbi:MAG: hypothetical protein BWX84_01070 [Verrucomicrobia bacterium ADurb.Bin118]|nr:MAG: hypothetical protein BWX84_01070 [Verrucomicrobia bacterium ADurb.Bin118]
MSPAFDPVQNGKEPGLFEWILAPELRVEIRRVLRHLRQGVIDLVKDCDPVFVQVLEGNPGFFAERHLPV